MAHRKYIKRDGKVFGPYYYENYREKGVTKTKYLGKNTVKEKKSGKKLIIILFFIALLLIFGVVAFLSEKDQGLKEYFGELSSEKGFFDLLTFLSDQVFFDVGLEIVGGMITSTYGIYEPLCCDGNSKTGEQCYTGGYVNPVTGSGAVYCDTGDDISKIVIQHNFSIRFNSITTNAGDYLECVLETSGTESQPGTLFPLTETPPAPLNNEDYYLSYTLKDTDEIVMFSDSAAPWYIHDCYIKDSGDSIIKSEEVNRRIYVHKSVPWTDTELTQIISCEGGSAGIFMNNIEKCLRTSPENVGSSKEYLYGFNMYGGATVEGACYDGINNDGSGGMDEADATCYGWWDNYVDRDLTVLPGYTYGMRSEKGVIGRGLFFDIFPAAYTDDSDNLDSFVLLPDTNTRVEYTVNVDPSDAAPKGYMKFRFTNLNMENRKYNIFLYDVPDAESLTIIGHGPGISSLTPDKLIVTLQSSGKHTVNLVCDNNDCDNGEDLDVVMIVDFDNPSLDDSYPIDVEFTFTAGSSDIDDSSANVYFDETDGLTSLDESQTTDATADNMCNDLRNNDLDISDDYVHIWDNVQLPNKIEYSKDCADADCHGLEGSELRGNIGICYYIDEGVNYPDSCRDNYDNDWNDNYLTDIYGYEIPSADYTDCHDIDCFQRGGGSTDIINHPCPLNEDNDPDWCGDQINNDWDYIVRGSGQGTHFSSCIFPTDTYNRVEPNSQKYYHVGRYALFDCMDEDCDNYDGDISVAGMQRCEHGYELTCDDDFNNDALQLKDCELGSSVSGRKNAPSFNQHAEYDCSSYCRAGNSDEKAQECIDRIDNDWDFWSQDPASYYLGIEQTGVGDGIDCRWLSYNPDEDCDTEMMNVVGSIYEQAEDHPDIVQCQLGTELNCMDNYDNDIDRDSSNTQSGWGGNNDGYRTYNDAADCADYDCSAVKDSLGDYDDLTGVYACPINERYRVDDGGASYLDMEAWCFDNIDNDLDGSFDCEDFDCEGAINPSPGENGLNNVLICAPFELDSALLLDDDVDTWSPNYCGNIIDDEARPDSDNFAVTIGGVDWESINYNSIRQQIQSQLGVSIMDCSDDDCYREFGQCAPCSSNEFVEWDSCFDNQDNDHDGDGDSGDVDCDGQIVNNRGYTLANNPVSETDKDGNCMNQYNDDNTGGISYNHPVLECRNEQTECAGEVFSPDGRVCPSIYTESNAVSCDDDFDNDGNNGIDCYDDSCFSECGITAYSGEGNIYRPQTATTSVGAVSLTYQKITRIGNDFYYTYNYNGDSSGETVLLDLGDASDSNRDINPDAFNTLIAEIDSDNCPSCNFVLSTGQLGYLRLAGVSQGSFSVTVRIPSLNQLMDPEDVLAAITVGSSASSEIIAIEVVNDQPPSLGGVKVEPEGGRITVGDPIYMRGHDFSGISGGQVHSGRAGWCKIEVSGAVSETLTNPNGASEKACTYITTVDAPGTYNFKVTPYDSTGNEGAFVTESLVISSVAPKIISPLARTEDKRVFFSSNESYDSFADIFNEHDGIMTARFTTDTSNPYGADSCSATIRDEGGSVVSTQTVTSSGGATTTCSVDLSLAGLGLSDGFYTLSVGAVDGQGYLLETQRGVFYFCDDLNSQGSFWDCKFTDFDADGYTQGIMQPFKYSDRVSLYQMECDSCPEVTNAGSDSDGDGIDDICDPDNAVCGNDRLEFGEECDDGNLEDGDGCSLDCKIEETPPDTPPGGDDGPSIPSDSCSEIWSCKSWSECFNLEKVNVLENMSSELMLIVKNGCSLWDWDEEVCGFQERDCEDIGNCRSYATRPDIIKECYYIPTCYDEIQNQDEEGVDCGGSCEPCEELPKPVKLSYLIWCIILLVILTALLLLVEDCLRKYKFLKKRLKKTHVKSRKKVSKRGVKSEKKVSKQSRVGILFILFALILLFVIFYFLICVKLFLIIPILILLMVILIRYYMRKRAKTKKFFKSRSKFSKRKRYGKK